MQEKHLLAGLDHAILGGINAEAGEKADAKRIAALLKHGAHALSAAEERAQAASSDFANEVLMNPVLPCLCRCYAVTAALLQL